MVDHRVVVFGLPSARLPEARRLGVRAEVHGRGVEPDEERLAARLLALDEVDGAGQELVVDRLHTLARERAGVVDPLRAVRIRPRVQHAPGPVLLSEAGEVLLRRVVAQLRLLLGVQVVEVAEELIEAVHRGQVLVAVAEMVLAELAGGVSERLQQLRDGRILGPHAERGPRQTDLGEARAKHALAHDEGRAARRAALLGVVVGEQQALCGDPIDVRRPVAHQALGKDAQVRLADVVAPDDQDVRLLRRLGQGLAVGGGEPDRAQAKERPPGRVLGSLSHSALLSTVVDANGTASSGSSGDAGHAHRRERPSDDSFGNDDRTIPGWHRDPLAELDAQDADRRQQQQSDRGLHYGYCRRPHGHCPPFIFFSANMLGSSSKSPRPPGLTRFASAGMSALKRLGETVASVFQFLTSIVYWGAPATFVLVMTYRHGYGRSPCAIQTCQSTSLVLKARCSHSTPPITPLPRSFVSTTEGISCL